MRDTITDLENWPTRDSGQPILKSTNEAFLYAQLVCNRPIESRALLHYREKTYTQLRLEREKKNPNLQAMMDLAVIAQLFREAFTETLRINNEKYQL